MRVAFVLALPLLGCEAHVGIALSESAREVPGLFVSEHRRSRSLLTVGLFGEYAGDFTCNTELPTFGIEIGFASEDDLLDVSRGVLVP